MNGFMMSDSGRAPPGHQCASGDCKNKHGDCELDSWQTELVEERVVLKLLLVVRKLLLVLCKLLLLPLQFPLLLRESVDVPRELLLLHPLSHNCGDEIDEVQS